MVADALSQNQRPAPKESDQAEEATAWGEVLLLPDSLAEPVAEDLQ